MRNVIPGILAGSLIGLPVLVPSPLIAQAGGESVSWTAPCFPGPRCEGAVPTAPLAGLSERAIRGSPAPRRVDLWPHAVSALSALVLASSLDTHIQSEVLTHRSEGGDDLARLAKRMGQPEVYAPVALGTLAVGLLAGDDRITRAGGRITGGLLLTGVAVNLLKPLVGRARPGFGGDAHDFRPFSRQDSWPSGHTAMAFALATSVSDEVRFTPVTIALYGGAMLTGWSRINDNRHWVTDVAAGALVGIASAKLMNGHWRVFGVRGPQFLFEGDRAGLRLAF